jgi:5-methylcytosine-specific restriction protein A
VSRKHSWLRDERLLALDLYLTEGTRASPSSISALSTLLRAFPIEAELAADPRFRSYASVATKLANFMALDPSISGGLTHASSEDAAVWAEFSDDPNGLRKVAVAIRQAALDPSTSRLPQPPPDFVEAEEGALLTRMHVARERSRRLVEAKKAAAAAVGQIACEVCGFDFEVAYGALGRGVIECHHRLPLSELVANRRTSLADLALVCANCHRMIHRRRRWMTIDELKSVISAVAADS